MDEIKRSADFSSSQAKLFLKELNSVKNQNRSRAIQKFQDYIKNYTPNFYQKDAESVFHGADGSSMKGLLFWCGASSSGNSDQLKRISAECIMFLRFLVSMQPPNEGEENIFLKLFLGLNEASLHLMSLSKHILLNSSSESSRSGRCDCACELLAAWLEFKSKSVTQIVDLDDILPEERTRTIYFEWLKNLTVSSNDIEKSNLIGTASNAAKAKLVVRCPTCWNDVQLIEQVVADDDDLDQSVKVVTDRGNIIDDANEASKPINDPLGILNVDLRAYLPSVVGAGNDTGDSLPTSLGELRLRIMKRSANNSSVQAQKLVRSGAMSSSLIPDALVSENDKITDTGSVLVSERNFNPALFMDQVHSTTNIEKLKTGMSNLSSDLHRQSTMRQNLARENIGLFLQCIDGLNGLKSKLSVPVEVSKPDKKAVVPTDKSKMTTVSNALSSLNNQTSLTLAPLLEKIDKIQRIRKATQMIRQLAMFVELPLTIRECIADGRFMDAVLVFKRSSRFTSTLSSDSSSIVTSVRERSLMELNLLYEKLCKSIVTPTLDSGSLLDQIAVLKELVTVFGDRTIDVLFLSSILSQITCMNSSLFQIRDKFMQVLFQTVINESDEKAKLSAEQKLGSSSFLNRTVTFDSAKKSSDPKQDDGDGNKKAGVLQRAKDKKKQRLKARFEGINENDAKDDVDDDNDKPVAIQPVTTAKQSAPDTSVIETSQAALLDAKPVSKIGSAVLTVALLTLARRRRSRQQKQSDRSKEVQPVERTSRSSQGDMNRFDDAATIVSGSSRSSLTSNMKSKRSIDGGDYFNSFSLGFDEKSVAVAKTERDSESDDSENYDANFIGIDDELLGFKDDDNKDSTASRRDVEQIMQTFDGMEKTADKQASRTGDVAAQSVQTALATQIKLLEDMDSAMQPDLLTIERSSKPKISANIGEDDLPQHTSNVGCVDMLLQLDQHVSVNFGMTPKDRCSELIRLKQIEQIVVVMSEWSSVVFELIQKFGEDYFLDCGSVNQRSINDSHDYLNSGIDIWSDDALALPATTKIIVKSSRRDDYSFDKLDSRASIDSPIAKICQAILRIQCQLKHLVFGSRHQSDGFAGKFAGTTSNLLSRPLQYPYFREAALLISELSSNITDSISSIFVTKTELCKQLILEAVSPLTRLSKECELKLTRELVSDVKQSIARIVASMISQFNAALIEDDLNQDSKKTSKKLKSYNAEFLSSTNIECRCLSVILDSCGSFSRQTMETLTELGNSLQKPFWSRDEIGESLSGFCSALLDGIERCLHITVECKVDLPTILAPLDVKLETALLSLVLCCHHIHTTILPEIWTAADCFFLQQMTESDDYMIDAPQDSNNQSDKLSSLKDATLSMSRLLVFNCATSLVDSVLRTLRYEMLSCWLHMLKRCIQSTSSLTDVSPAQVPIHMFRILTSLIGFRSTIKTAMKHKVIDIQVHGSNYDPSHTDNILLHDIIFRGMCDSILQFAYRVGIVIGITIRNSLQLIIGNSDKKKGIDNSLKQKNFAVFLANIREEILFLATVFEKFSSEQQATRIGESALNTSEKAPNVSPGNAESVMSVSQASLNKMSGIQDARTSSVDSSNGLPGQRRGAVTEVSASYSDPSGQASPSIMSIEISKAVSSAASSPSSLDFLVTRVELMLQDLYNPHKRDSSNNRLWTGDDSNSKSSRRRSGYAAMISNQTYPESYDNAGLWGSALLCGEDTASELLEVCRLLDRTALPTVTADDMLEKSHMFVCCLDEDQAESKTGVVFMNNYSSEYAMDDNAADDQASYNRSDDNDNGSDAYSG